jgi:hypothetical protein
VKVSTNVKFFLAVLAVAFALQVMFDIQSDWNNPEKAFVSRLLTSGLLAAAGTFFWNQFRPKKPE